MGLRQRRRSIGGNVGEVEIVRKPVQQQMAAMAADRRRSRGWGCVRRGGRPDGGERDSAATGLRDVGRGRQPPLAVDEVDMHEIAGVGRRRQIGQAEFMSHLVDHGGQQVEMSSRGVGRISEKIGAGGVRCMGKFKIVPRRRIDKPAVAGGVGVDHDVSGAVVADDVAGEIGDREGDCRQRRQLRCGGARVRPVGDGGRDDSIELGLH